MNIVIPWRVGLINNARSTTASKVSSRQLHYNFPRAMQAEKHRQPWKINVCAKYKKLNFRFKATRTLPFTFFSNFHRLCILLRLHKFMLQVKSECPTQQRRALRSKFVGAFEKFRARSSRKQSAVVQEPETKSPINRLRRLASEEPACIGSLVVGIIALLFEKDRKGIIVLSSVVLLYFVLLLKKYVTGKSAIALAISMVFCFGSFMNYDQVQGYIANFAWKHMLFLRNM